MGDDGLAHVIADPVPEGEEDAVQEAAASCPSESIKVE
jgi:ferredoxin